MVRRDDERLLLQALRRPGQASEADLAPRTNLDSIAMAGLFYGGARQRDDFLHQFAGPAIGGNAVGGNCVRGASGNSGNLGVMPVSPGRLASAPDQFLHVIQDTVRHVDTYSVTRLARARRASSKLHARLDQRAVRQRS
jgi:hypothetical protein